MIWWILRRRGLAALRRKMQEKLLKLWAPLHNFLTEFFTAKTQETPAIFFSIAICIKICQSFSMAKKSVAKSFMQRGHDNPAGNDFKDSRI